MSRYTKNAKVRHASSPPAPTIIGTPAKNLILAVCPCGKASLPVHKKHVGARLVSCGRKGCKR